MEYYLIRFACTEQDEIKNYLLKSKKYDDWVTGEPPQGYKHFEFLWCGEIEKIIQE